jgi:carboxyl-terminal processing protease
MKSTIFLCCLLIAALFSNRVSSQSKELKFLIDTSITIMQKHSANAGSVNWNKITKTAYSKAAGLTDPYQAGPVIRYLFQSLDDFHGKFFYKDSTFSWVKKPYEANDSIRNEWKKGIKSITWLFENNIGYLRVPSMRFGGKEVSDQQAQSLNDSLCVLLNKNIKSIILDLRLNGGGAMYPMILGLEQLLEPGKLGSFNSKKGESWILENNNFRLDTMVLASITPKSDVNATKIPVVLLTSTATGSSAEFLIMAFKPRKKTILMGSTTAGFITSTREFPINSNSSILLSTGYGSDRNGKLYKKAIDPDIFVNGIDNFNDIPNDVKVKAAVKWLKGQ